MRKYLKKRLKNRVCWLPSMARPDRISLLFIATFKHWKVIMSSSCSLPFFKLNTPSSISLSSYERCCSPLSILMAFHWSLSNSSPTFLCWVTRASTSDGSSQGQSRGGYSLPYTAATLLLLPSRMLLTSQAPRAHCCLMCSFCPPGSSNPFLQGCSH